MRCSSCKTEVTLPHKCKNASGPFTLAAPDSIGTAEEVFGDEGPKFSNGPDDYDPEQATVRFGDPHEGEDE